jgi:hypothetical protein
MPNQQKFKRNNHYKLIGGLAFHFSSQVQTLGPTYSGVVAGEQSNEISFPGRTTIDQLSPLMVNKYQTPIDFHLSPGDFTE